MTPFTPGLAGALAVLTLGPVIEAVIFGVIFTLLGGLAVVVLILGVFAWLTSPRLVFDACVDVARDPWDTGGTDPDAEADEADAGRVEL